MTKISKIIEAGKQIEKNKTGFTVPELMSVLDWEDKEKQYVQNTMFHLTRRGQAYKLGNSRPVVYSFRPKSDSAEPSKPVAAAEKTEVSVPRPQPGPNTPPVPPGETDRRKPVVTLEDLADLDITLEMIGEGVFRRNRELERRIYELESEMVELKRKLDDANKRIGEQTRMIEKQNQIISGQNQDRRSTAKLKSVGSFNWKRRP